MTRSKPTPTPSPLTQAEFVERKQQLAELLNGQCEVCGRFTSRLFVAYLGKEPFDDDGLIGRCQRCQARKRTTIGRFPQRDSEILSF
jgi:hypothetical protein